MFSVECGKLLIFGGQSHLLGFKMFKDKIIM